MQYSKHIIIWELRLTITASSARLCGSGRTCSRRSCCVTQAFTSLVFILSLLHPVSGTASANHTESCCRPWALYTDNSFPDSFYPECDAR